MVSCPSCGNKVKIRDINNNQNEKGGIQNNGN